MASQSEGGNVHEAGWGSTALRRAALALVATALCAYGYGQEQDPFLGAWKLVASEANQGHWDQAGAAAPGLDAGLAEIESNFGWSLRAGIRSALASRDARALARELTVAGCGAVLRKLDASEREGLADYYRAKYRIESARTIYSELLAPALRRQDATRRGNSHEVVFDGLARAQAALGRPGFLGRGQVPPDLAAYTAASREIETALRAAFPFVPEVKR